MLQPLDAPSPPLWRSAVSAAYRSPVHSVNSASVRGRTAPSVSLTGSIGLLELIGVASPRVVPMTLGTGVASAA